MSGGSDLTASARPQFVPSPNIFPMAHQNQFRPRPQPAWENFQVPMAMEANSTPQLPPQYQPSPLPQTQPPFLERKPGFQDRRPEIRPRPSHQGGKLPPKSPIIQVDRVPLEHLTIDKLNEHFKKFGLIVNIQLVPQEKRALVEFSTVQEAFQAVKSPEAIFGNR